MAARLLQVAIAFDQFANCLISLAIGGGWADETISARMWRNRALPGWRESRWLVDKLFWRQPEPLLPIVCLGVAAEAIAG